MGLLQELLNQADASLADRVERLAEIILQSPVDAQADYRREVAAWIEQPERERLGVSLAGRLGMEEVAEQVYEGLQRRNLPASHHAALILALGQIGHRVAKRYIADNFLKGRTKAAATIALLLLDPEMARESLQLYDAQEGMRIAGIALLECYALRSPEEAKHLVGFIPPDFLKGMSEFYDIPPDLGAEIAKYVRL